MKLIKHFDFTKMEELDKQDWNISVGEKWANNELQQYVDSPNNLYFQDGLHLRATYEDGIIKSSRINTSDKFFFKYGKIDIIAKVPDGLGTWPALWMMPQFNKYGHWPKSGEIDIMEHSGKNVDHLFLCIHTEGYNHRKQEQYFIGTEVKGLTKSFQKFGLEWNEQEIIYYLNDQEMGRYGKGENGKDATHVGWPFDEEFYLIINLAIGGTFGGEVDVTVLPQEFIVKDIKIYQ